jgi:hypothetical protein
LSSTLSLRLIREIHGRLLTGVRGGERTPGEFRRSQNWIGPPGCTLANATYVPPPVHELLAALDNFEKFLHDRGIPVLIHCGLAHAQFETSHRDGSCHHDSPRETPATHWREAGSSSRSGNAGARRRVRNKTWASPANADILGRQSGETLVVADAEHFTVELLDNVKSQTNFELLVPMPDQPSGRKKRRIFVPKCSNRAGLATRQRSGLIRPGAASPGLALIAQAAIDQLRKRLAPPAANWDAEHLAHFASGEVSFIHPKKSLLTRVGEDGAGERVARWTRALHPGSANILADRRAKLRVVGMIRIVRLIDFAKAGWMPTLTQFM